MSSTSNLVIFGAGRRGKYICEQLQHAHIEPYCFIDNNRNIIGTQICNLYVKSPDILNKMKEYRVIVSVKHNEGIIEQIMGYNIPQEKIIIYRNYCDLFEIIIEHNPECYKNLKKDIELDSNGVIFDIENGLVLGGVETWAIQTGDILKNNGRRVSYLLSERVPMMYRHDGCIIYKDYDFLYPRIKSICLEIQKSNNQNIICNFAGSNLLAACFFKLVFGEKVNLVCVIHSDSTGYYESYIALAQYIDKCLVISNAIKSKLLAYGFPLNKIYKLDWFIECDNYLSKSYSSSDSRLKIGYAGRLEKVDKRADLLLELIDKICEKEIPCEIYIAGEGKYFSIIQSYLQRNGIDNVYLLGIIDHDRIKSFWKSKDVMISCSEREGHSLTQVEAMSCGVVPIITDVSGARDDVVDGENGYIVPIGEVDTIVHKLEYLCNNREMLKTLGEKAYMTVKNNNSLERQEALWKQILR